MTEAAMPRSRFSIWLQAVRAFSFTASMAPVFIGAGLALYHDGPVMWGLFPLVVACSLLPYSDIGRKKSRVPYSTKRRCL